MAKQLIEVQQCRSRDGLQVVPVRSHTDQQKVYNVLSNVWGNVNEYVCQCKGYVNRGKCRHQQEAAQHLCGWADVMDNGQWNPLAQTDEQADAKVCPKCGGPTMYVLELVEEDDG